MMRIILAASAAAIAAVATLYFVWRWWRALAEVRRGLDALGSWEKARPVLIAARVQWESWFGLSTRPPPKSRHAQQGWIKIDSSCSWC